VAIATSGAARREGNSSTNGQPSRPGLGRRDSILLGKIGLGEGQHDAPFDDTLFCLHTGHRLPPPARHDLPAKSREQTGVGSPDVVELLEVAEVAALAVLLRHGHAHQLVTDNRDDRGPPGLGRRHHLGHRETRMGLVGATTLVPHADRLVEVVRVKPRKRHGGM
jgi:hypothetical protein